MPVVSEHAATDGIALKRILIVTDAWLPQVNGVVKTLQNTAAELEKAGHVVGFLTPQSFRTLPCPTYPDIRLSLCTSGLVARQIDAFAPDALHIATEGPLGWSARGVAVKRGWRFTTAYHTRFPEYVAARSPIPASWSYALLRRFHAPSSAVMAPTPAIVRDLDARRFANVVHWSRGVDHAVFGPAPASTRRLQDPPVFLYAGRVSVEKNIEAFLDLDLPGSKVVVGDGPQRQELMRRYPKSHFFIANGDDELARYYSAADVFVFPSLTDTFGLVMLESLACGTPVAAFPVPGPLDVLGGEPVGCLDQDLARAAAQAMAIPGERCVAYAKRFSWNEVASQFLAPLAPIHAAKRATSAA